jgi:hypothetical protein
MEDVERDLTKLINYYQKLTSTDESNESSSADGKPSHQQHQQQLLIKQQSSSPLASPQPTVQQTLSTPGKPPIFYLQSSSSSSSSLACLPSNLNHSMLTATCSAPLNADRLCEAAGSALALASSNNSNKSHNDSSVLKLSHPSTLSLSQSKNLMYSNENVESPSLQTITPSTPIGDEHGGSFILKKKLDNDLTSLSSINRKRPSKKSKQNKTVSERRKQLKIKNKT